jgi:hypothetical protein
VPTGVEYVLVLLAAVAGSASLVGVGMWLHNRVKRLEDEKRDLLNLTGQMDALREQVDVVQGHLGEINERLDFTERLVVQERDRKRELPSK